jgi:hypothetical protein
MIGRLRTVVNLFQARQLLPEGRSRSLKSTLKRACVREYAECGAVGSVVDRARQPHMKINRRVVH